MNKVLVVTIAVALAAGSAVAQAPDMFHVLLPASGATFVERDQASGTLSSNGITATWSSDANSATIRFYGNYTTAWLHPSVDLAWLNTAANLPMAIHMTCAVAGGTYDFAAPFSPVGGSWDWSHQTNGLTGAWNWGTYFPACTRFDTEIDLAQQNVDFDMTITWEWGTGVPTDEATWGDVKALFR
ncbi:MAG TPA: hypothetical protein PLQ13_10855 [Candidatus Krumholzibacteria bacterium]|nr:hypothetical protein [Candidatus Krumholzibacteria bacterium]